MSRLVLRSDSPAPLDYDDALTAADAVWVATALLHQEHPEAQDFPSAEIASLVRQLRLTHCMDATLNAHIAKHCVANTKPDPNRVRMLFATARGRRRLFRSGDTFDAGRSGYPSHPEWGRLPQRFRSLRSWYENVWSVRPPAQDQLLAAAGIGKRLWSDQDADDYVRELRVWDIE